MKQVFYLITELDVGGAEKMLCQLATGLDRERFVPTVGCLTGRGPMADRLKAAGVEVVFIDLRGWWDLPALLRLRRELRARRPQVLHCFLFHANLAGRLAAVGLRVRRVIASIRVEEPRRSHLWLERITNSLVDVLTCVSESARQYMHRRAGIPLAKMVAVPNCVTPEQCDVPVCRTPDEWAVPESAPVVAAVGRIDEQKDPMMLLTAAAAVVRAVPETIFVFAGNGPLMEKCRARTRELGLERNIRWIGWVPDVRPLLARMDVLALASRWEGMPNVALEAMACRKPVVATAVGGTPEVVVDGDTGILVRSGDAEGMAAALLRLLQDRMLAAAMGRRGGARVDEKFTVAAMVRANEALYD